MEMLREEDLGAELAKQRALPPAEVLAYLGRVAIALDGGSTSLKILDSGRALGTPLYMAPEQIEGEGEIGPRADLYALGQVAYALLTGEPYWAEEAAADPSPDGLLTKVMAGAVEPPVARALRRRGVKLPPGFDPWFFKATALTRAVRFERAGKQISALAEVFAAPPPSAEPPTIPTPSLAPSTQPSTGPGLPPTAHAPVPVITVESPPIDLAHPPAQAIAATPEPALPFPMEEPAQPPPRAIAPIPPTIAMAAVPAPAEARPRSRRRLIALAVAGTLVAAGLVAGGIVLFQGLGGDDARPTPHPHPSASPAPARPARGPGR